MVIPRVQSKTYESNNKMRNDLCIPFRLSGISVFYPYFLLYLAWLAMGWQTSSLLNIYLVLHLLFATATLTFLLIKLHQSKISPTSALFWLALFLMLILPGAYLEFPADSFEHFRRIVTWSKSTTIADNSLWQKSQYFWHWSLLQFVPIELRRYMLDFISALTQLILAIQVYSLSRAFGFDRKSSFIQILAFFALFGTSIFGIRYYALSTTILAYAAYLRGVELLITPWVKATRLTIMLKSMELLLLAAFIGLNHLQELLFLLIGLSLVLTVSFSRKYFQKFSLPLLCSVSAIALSGIIFGVFMKSEFPMAYGNQPQHLINYFGSYNIFHPSARVLNTIGIHGAWSILFALLLIRKKLILCLLTIAPLFLLLFPPSFLILSQLLPSSAITYRIALAFPSSFLFVYSLQVLLSRVTKFQNYRNAHGLLISTLIVTIGLVPVSPFFGRLYFQMHFPERDRTLVELDTTADWLAQNFQHINSCFFVTDYDLKKVTTWQKRTLPNTSFCVIVTDPITAFSLSTHFGEKYWMSRLSPKKFGEKLLPCDELVNFLSSPPFNSAAILLAKKNILPEVAPSIVSELSRHWNQKNSNLKLLLANEQDSIVECLIKRNWKEQSVPPYYLLFTPPSQ